MHEFYNFSQIQKNSVISTEFFVVQVRLLLSIFINCGSNINTDRIKARRRRYETDSINQLEDDVGAVFFLPDGVFAERNISSSCGICCRDGGMDGGVVDFPADFHLIGGERYVLYKKKIS